MNSNGRCNTPYTLHVYAYIGHRTKTYLYNSDAIKAYLYIVKLGFAGVNIIFLISPQENIDCRYSLEPPRRDGSNEYPQSMFWAEIWKYQKFDLKILSFRWWNFQYIFNIVYSNNREDT